MEEVEEKVVKREQRLGQGGACVDLGFYLKAYCRGGFIYITYSYLRSLDGQRRRYPAVLATHGRRQHCLQLFGNLLRSLIALYKNDKTFPPLPISILMPRPE